MLLLCHKCKTNQPKENFHRALTKKRGYNIWCKTCFKQYEAARYKEKDAPRKIKNKQNSIARGQAYIWEILTSNACNNCGETNPLVLEFHHNDPTLKEAEISMLYNYSIKSIKKELEKCTILCCNCHTIETRKARNDWRWVKINA